jgi:hypothetical protein
LLLQFLYATSLKRSNSVNPNSVPRVSPFLKISVYFHADVTQRMKEEGSKRQKNWGPVLIGVFLEKKRAIWFSNVTETEMTCHTGCSSTGCYQTNYCETSELVLKLCTIVHAATGQNSSAPMASLSQAGKKEKRFQR